jgi:cobalamin biosynthesis protein CobD/CbiB
VARLSRRGHHLSSYSSPLGAHHRRSRAQAYSRVKILHRSICLNWAIYKPSSKLLCNYGAPRTYQGKRHREICLGGTPESEVASTRLWTKVVDTFAMQQIAKGT